MAGKYPLTTETYHYKLDEGRREDKMREAAQQRLAVLARGGRFNRPTLMPLLRTAWHGTLHFTDSVIRVLNSGWHLIHPAQSHTDIPAPPPDSKAAKP